VLRAPMGQFATFRYFPMASFREDARPSTDMLYSTAWLNLTKEPYVFSLPEEGSRYYFMPMLSGWTDVFQAPGTRTTGAGAQKYVITGPHFSGELPNDLIEIKAPTNLVWIHGGTYCTGAKSDYLAVHAIQEQYKLQPLSTYGKPYSAPRALVDGSIDMQTPVRRQVDEMKIGKYFKLLAALLQENPPAVEDAPLLERIKKIGIEPGKDFDIGACSKALVYEIETAHSLALSQIRTAASSAAKVNGWEMSLSLGRYGTDYLKRAAVAATGLGANLPQDAINLVALTDQNGEMLKGNNSYVLHFPKGETPPVHAIWSLTLYNDQHTFVENALDRYALSPRDALKYNPDGSLDLYVQYENPGSSKEANWLPAPEEDFILMLRLYWPDEKVLKGLWHPPKVQKVGVPLKDRVYQDIVG